MKKKTRKILMIVMAVAFAAIMVGSSTVALFGGFGNPKNTAQTSTVTGTPADNYDVAQRAAYCGSGDAQSRNQLRQGQAGGRDRLRRGH